MPSAAEPEFVVDFPTLWVVPEWMERHCIIPDQFSKGRPFVMGDWQLWCTVNHYRVKPTAKVGQLATAFHFRRSQIVGPQKCGKGPWSAGILCNEACGPAVFNGWATGKETFDCLEHGCSCGWVYKYRRGEPMGWPWPTPLIQLVANSEDQTDNVYGPLQAMARGPYLSERMRVGEDFIRLPNAGRIDTVTSKARSRLGAPIIFALQDESGLYTESNGMVLLSQVQRRNAAGMGGRTIETTNAWDPAENSTAQRTFESQRPDIFRFYREPPKNLSYRNKVERARIHRYVYAGSPWVDLNAIEAEAAELIETDAAQAERFFGNRLVQGSGTWMPPGLWEQAYAGRLAS